MRFAILLLLSSLLVVSCGGSADPKDLADEGYSALSADDCSGALEAYEKALEAIGDDSAHPLFLEVSLGAIEARSVTDPDRAIADLKALAEKHPDAVTDKEYSKIGIRLGSQQSVDLMLKAAEVVGLAKERFPESEYLDRQGNQLAEKAEKLANETGDSRATDAFKGLGYTGG